MKARTPKARGMRDILPSATIRFEHIRRTAQSFLEVEGYRRIQTPTIERKELYANKLRSSSDIFSRETYSFYDRLSKKFLTLRPENTASVVRAVTSHNLLSTGPERLWYDEPMFRRERQQKGRYRQFYQVGVETFGFEGIEVEVELLVLCGKLLDALGLRGVKLQLNTLGIKLERPGFEDCLLRYLSDHKCCSETYLQACAVCPLKILDSKVLFLEETIGCSPQMHQFLSHRSLFRFATLLELLAGQGVTSSITPTMVRGIDYYEHTVFEWRLDDERQTLVAGGRYDSLVKSFGCTTGGCGWALGLDRLEETHITCPTFYADVVILYGCTLEWRIAHNLKRELEGFNLVVVLRPKRNLSRTRRSVATIGSNFLIHMTSESSCNPRVASLAHAELLSSRDAVSFVLCRTCFDG